MAQRKFAVRGRIVLYCWLAQIVIPLGCGDRFGFGSVPLDEILEEPEGSERVHLQRHDAAVMDRYLVILKDEIDAPHALLASTSQRAQQLTESYGGTIIHTYEHAVYGYAVAMTEEEAIVLAQSDEVAYVEEDGEYSVVDTQDQPPWNLDRIDQPTLPLDRQYQYSLDGSGVTAYILDTGIRDSHGDFGDRAAEGFTAIDDGRGAQDCNGHGTHVAATIGGTTYGVAKNVKLVGVRVLGCTGKGSTSGIVAALEWLTDHAEHPAVANLSFGGGRSTTLDRAVRHATEAGIAVAVAAGNESMNACNLSPAREPRAITVGASDANDGRAYFSNYGECLALFAPGRAIKSAWHASDTAAKTRSGTSMASPHVAGAAALHLQQFPDASPAQIEQALSTHATIDELKAIKSGSPNKLLNIAYLQAEPQPAPPAPPPQDREETQRTGQDARTAHQGQSVYYRDLNVAPGTKVTVEMTGTGDADLYVRFDARPTFAHWDCRPFRNGSRESCYLTVPAHASTVQIRVYAYRTAAYELAVAWSEP